MATHLVQDGPVTRVHDRGSIRSSVTEDTVHVPRGTRSTECSGGRRPRLLVIHPSGVPGVALGDAPAPDLQQLHAGHVHVLVTP